MGRTIAGEKGERRTGEREMRLEFPQVDENSRKKKKIILKRMNNKREWNRREKKTPLKNVKKIYSIKYSISRCEKVNEGKKTYLRLSGHESRIRKEKKNIFTPLNKITYIYTYIFFFYVTYVVNCRESLKKREREIYKLVRNPIEIGPVFRVPTNHQRKISVLAHLAPRTDLKRVVVKTSPPPG